MKIIIYGGSFDPVHKGHIKVATEALKKINADFLYFVPCYKSPDLKKIKANWNDRIEMLKLAIKNEKKFRICEYERFNKNISYTIFTVKYFKEIYKNDEIFVLVGSDQYINIHKWKNISEIRKLSRIICFERSGFIPKINNQDVFIKNKNLDVCSRDIIYNPSLRLIDDSVLNYINKNGVYAIHHLKYFNLSDYRLKHCVDVSKLAVEFAKNYNHEIMQKALIAGIYHDIVKEIPKEEIEKYAIRMLKINSWVSWKVLHAPVGADILKNRFLFNDENVLNAIANHTIPNSDDLLTKILFCADKLVFRENEEFSERNTLIEIGKKDIDKCFFLLNNLIKKKYEKG